MLSKLIKSSVLALTLLSSVASASLITFETQEYTGGVPATDYMSVWDAASGQINSSQLEEFSNVKVGNNRFNHLVIEFDMKYDGMWGLDIGLDAGRGAEVFVDGVSILKDTSNIWWANRWNHGDVLSLENIALSNGKHTIELFWIEDCCNGANNILLTDHRTGNVSTLSVAALDAASVPEPLTIAMFGLALCVMGAQLRRG